MDGPSQGDVVAAPRIFLDSHLAGLVSGGGRLDWNAFREKLWIVHRALARG